MEWITQCNWGKLGRTVAMGDQDHILKQERSTIFRGQTTGYSWQ